MEDPLEVVAEELVKESILLCLDEFMVCFPGGNSLELLCPYMGLSEYN
jgi:predicted ATPase